MWRNRGDPTTSVFAFAQWQAAAAEIDATRTHADRIAIQVGGSVPVTRTYIVAYDPLMKYRAALIPSNSEDYPTDGSIDQARATAEAACTEYLLAAKELVGADAYRFPSPLYPRLPLPPGRES